MSQEGFSEGIATQPHGDQPRHGSTQALLPPGRIHARDPEVAAEVAAEAAVEAAAAVRDALVLFQSMVVRVGRLEDDRATREEAGVARPGPAALVPAGAEGDRGRHLDRGEGPAAADVDDGTADGGGPGADEEDDEATADAGPGNGEEVEVGKYPADSYSFMALNGPFDGRFFWFGAEVWFVQMMLYILLIISVVIPVLSTIDVDNPDEDVHVLAAFIPANASPLAKISQLVCLISYCTFANDSIVDLVTAVETFPRFSKAEPGDKINCMVCSCILRGLQGLLATIAVLLLIITTSDVREIILNFTAVNFVSAFDNLAFNQARLGKYGPKLEAEANRIKDAPAPACMVRKYRHVRSLSTIIPVGFIMVTLFFIVNVYQCSSSLWLTQRFRIQFKDDSDIQEYSGCYDVVGGFDSQRFMVPRYLYKSWGNGEPHATFGYCSDERRWYLFKGNETSACEAGSNDTLALVLARSDKTSAYDIATVFDGAWFSSNGNPLELYFIENETLVSNSCDMFLGDGICDEGFNLREYGYDEGDCCAATCEGVQCGIGTVRTSFGITVTSGDGYPRCIDPAMKPVTIKLNHVTREENSEVHDLPPQDPALMLDCDGKNILMVNIVRNMTNGTQTVMVPDKAACTITIRNSTGPMTGSETANVNFVTYTVYHGDAKITEANPIVILQGDSSETETSSFHRIPVCFRTKLDKYINVTTMYTGNDPPHKAIEWLVKDSSKHSNCEREFFLQRYALVAINFAALINGEGCGEDYYYDDGNESVSALNDGGSLESLDEDSLWITAERECAWPNVVCIGGNVTELNLGLLGLSGTIPTEIGLLKHLTSLNLAYNDICGSIPVQVGELQSLSSLSLEFNKITGSLPTEIGKMRNLNFFHMGDNIITGTLPTEMGQLESLKIFEISGNKITGTMPTEIWSMLNLERFRMGDNIITGTLPKEMGQLESLKIFEIFGNKITGTMPTEIWSMLNLERFRMGGNKITGTIPTEAGRMLNLEGFDIRDNAITGTVPTEIGQMESLWNLDISGNKITGTIPTEVGRMLNVYSFWMRDNAITGTVPTEIGQLESLNNFFISGNKITGTIPTEVGRMLNLEDFIMGDNAITGTVPTEIGQMESLWTLDIRGNKITGTIPTEIGRMLHVHSFWMGDNAITGTLPTEIGQLENLQHLLISGNKITGTIPTEVGRMLNLEDFEMGDNATRGTLPAEIGQLDSLWTLDIRGNKITGTIPTEVGNLPNLDIEILTAGFGQQKAKASKGKTAKTRTSQESNVDPFS